MTMLRACARRGPRPTPQRALAGYADIGCVHKKCDADCPAGAVLRIEADCVQCGLVREPWLESPLFGEGSQLGAGFQARAQDMHPLQSHCRHIR